MLLLLTSTSFASRFAGEYEMYGTINHKYGITMLFTVEGSNVYGNYKYDTEKGRLTINGTIDAQGSVVLYESDNKGKRTGVFRGTISQDLMRFHGTWSTPDGRTAYPFDAAAPGC